MTQYRVSNHSGSIVALRYFVPLLLLAMSTAARYITGCAQSAAAPQRSVEPMHGLSHEHRTVLLLRVLESKIKPCV